MKFFWLRLVFGLSLGLFALGMAGVLLVPRLLPGQDQIAFEHDTGRDYDIFMIDLQTGVQWDVTALFGDERRPSWSGDGRHILFDAYRGDGVPSIYILDTITGDINELDSSDLLNWRPVWSPDEQRITFMVNFDSIYVMNADGTQPIFLTTGFAPSWTADSQHIVYYTNQQNSLNSDIYMLKIDGTGFRNLSQHPSNDWDPVWSPDGTRIAFTSARDGNAEIYTMTICAVGEVGCRPLIQRLTNHPATDKTPAWSADGRYLAFESERDGQSQLYIVAADCDATAVACPARRITWGEGYSRYPTWRPN